MQAPFGVPAGAHVQLVSTGTADVHVAAPPAGAHSFMVTVQTNGIYLTLDGTNPSSSNGLHVVKDTAPIYFPAGKPVIVASDTAATATVNLLWFG